MAEHGEPGDNAADRRDTRDIKMSDFTADSDPDDQGRKWKKWQTELITRFCFFRILEVQDKVDAINIYGGELIRVGGHSTQ